MPPRCSGIARAGRPRALSGRKQTGLRAVSAPGPSAFWGSGAVGILGEFITGQVSLFGGRPALPGGQSVSEDRQNGCWWELSGIVTFALLNNVREWLSPGSLRRAERRLKAAGDQGPFLPPGKLDA